MKHMYGSGLRLAPDGFFAKSLWRVRRITRRLILYALRPFDLVGLKRLRVHELIWVRARRGLEVGAYRTLHPASEIQITAPGDAKFVAACKHYSSGVVPLGEAFVCEVSPAFYFPALGLVANENFQVFGDSVLLPHRFHLSLSYRSFRPLRFTRRAGAISSIQRIDAYNFWHWMADCLPQVLTLEKYMEGRPLTLLASEDLGEFQRETLKYMLPNTMNLEFVPKDRWIKVDRFILPSYLSGRCNGYLPENYYAEIRRRIARGVGLAESAEPQLRLYLSRAGAKRRRVSNEEQVMASLARYGFTAIRPENMSLREQVSAFQQAEVIVGPHGAAFGGMVFSTQAKLLVLYPEKNPGEYFYTMARRIGLEHHGLIHDFYDDEDSTEDFPVDVERMEALLEGAMGIRKLAGAAAP